MDHSPLQAESPAQSSVEPLATSEAIATLRHDLYTPINQIIGYSELLEEEAAEEQPSYVADLRKIQQAAAQLHHLIRTRLELTLRDGDSDRATAVTVASPPGLLAAPRPFELPQDRVDDGEDAAPALARPARVGHILVVDDDALNRDMLSSRLMRLGHTVSSAADGLEALERVRQQRFDLVLLDVMMPRLDGYGTLKRLKADEEWRHLPVIMISALDDLSSVVRCIEAGAEEYLPKPFNPTLLRARIGACLEKKALRDQEVELYQNLSQGQKRLDRELQSATTYVANLSDELRQDPRVAPLLAAFQRMTSAVSLRETELRATIKELEIKINTSALQHQVGSIVADPSFSSLAERARAMRQRRSSPPAA
jgi:sigma-B regulation protein RsbU (phosphoserine phosphatase)